MCDNDYWKDKFAEQENSGLSILKWCEKENINRSRFFRWKKKLKNLQVIDDNAAVEWIPLKNISPKQVSIKLERSGMSIEVSCHFEEVSELSNLLKELKSIC